MADSRSYDSAEYKRWRNAVLTRDNFTCAITGAKQPLEVHHIKPWSQHPELRFSVSNGITLERSFHQDVVTGHEKEFEARFIKLVQLRSAEGPVNSKDTKKFTKKTSGPIRGKWKPRNPNLRF